MERWNSLRWLESLPQLTQSYNNSFHRSICSTPDQAWDKAAITDSELWAHQYLPKKVMVKVKSERGKNQPTNIK